MVAINENDWLLEEIVNVINGTEKELQITFVAEGVTISGKIVSCHRYLDYTHALLRSKDLIPDPKIDIRLPIDKQNIDGDILGRRINYTREKSSSKFDPGRPGFIHIKDANINGREKSVFWRGSIEKVSGFYLDF